MENFELVLTVQLKQKQKQGIQYTILYSLPIPYTIHTISLMAVTCLQIQTKQDSKAPKSSKHQNQNKAKNHQILKNRCLN
mgnify:CR=1 FL=1